MRVAFIVLCAAAIAGPRAAHAGRTYFGWLYGTDVMPERGAEIQTWVSEENYHGASETEWWTAPAIGVTDKVELLLPVTFDWTYSDADGSRTTFANYGVDVRYRLVTPDPTDAPPIIPLLRFVVKRLVEERDHVQPELDLVLAYNVKRAQVSIDAGAMGDLGPGYHHFELHPAAGVSIDVVHQLRLGAEVFAQASLDNYGYSWIAVGPNLAWTHGRTWISAAYGIGVYRIRDAPKLNWGIAF